MKKIHQQQDHIASYYAASTNINSEYPILKGKQSADVCIIGGGFTGVSTALTLAERGYSVIIIEANKIGWGASGRNGGQLINGITGLDALNEKYGKTLSNLLWDLRWRGNDIIYDRVAKYNIQCDLKKGFVEVATKPKQLKYINEYLKSYGLCIS